MAVAGRHLQGHAAGNKMDIDTGMEIDNPTMDSTWHNSIKYKVAKAAVKQYGNKRSSSSSRSAALDQEGGDDGVKKKKAEGKLQSPVRGKLPTEINSRPETSTVPTGKSVIHFTRTDCGPFKAILSVKERTADKLRNPPRDLEVARALYRIGVKYTELERIGRIKWVIFFESRGQANSAMDNPLWQESKYKIEIPWAMVHRNVVIRRIPLDISTGELIDEIRESNPEIPIVEATRLKRKNNKDGSTEWEDTESVKLTLRSVSCPSHITLWKVKTSVYPFVPQIRRCFNCGQLSHNTKFCKNHEKCLRCGEDKHQDDCVKPESCINCKGPHRSLHPKCPEVIEKTAITRVMAERNIGFNEAKEVVTGNTLNPTPPELNQNSFPALGDGVAGNNRRGREPNKGNNGRNPGSNSNINTTIPKRFNEVVKNNQGSSKEKKTEEPKFSIPEYLYALIRKEKVARLLDILNEKVENKDLDTFIDNLLTMSKVPRPQNIGPNELHPNGSIQNPPVELPKYKKEVPGIRS